MTRIGLPAALNLKHTFHTRAHASAKMFFDVFWFLLEVKLSDMSAGMTPA